MNLLRVVLLGLAAVVLAALGWRLGTQPPRAVPAVVAQSPAAPPAPAPVVTAPAVPPVFPPQQTAGATPATPTPPPQAPSPAPVSPPIAPPAPAPSAAPLPPAAMTAQAARARIDTVLPAAPELARAFDVLRAQFPAVAERSMAEATEAFRQSGTLPSPDDLFGSAMHDLRQSAGVLAAKAGSEALGAIFDTKGSVLAGLEQADPRICADYLFGGASPEFNDFEASHRALVAQAALANIDAMADGRTRQKSWGAPTDEDFRWIEAQLAKRGLSSEEIGALLDGRAANPTPSDVRLCDNARTYLDVLKTMPVEGRNRVYGLSAELLARS